MFSGNWNDILIELLISIPAVLLCLSVHEAAHGFAANALGDPTAKNAGRLTLDPIHHLDPIGTICLLLFHVGWAKPVPVDVRYFKKPRRDIALVSLAGPLSNFLLALIALFLQRIFMSGSSTILLAIGLFCYSTAVMSIGLGVFNLIPVPPLDGSKILFSFLPYQAELKFARYQQYIQFGVLILLFLGVLDTPINIAINFVYRILNAVVGLVL
ncbi:site-2 protease family protein [Butyricicoccus sp.]|uniref:site-2 protease family protein n=1 Tax=Butyricicoccus sp. TaxID=2049021 RepID=UPI003F145740